MECGKIRLLKNLMGVCDMEQRLRDLRSKSNPKARIKIMEGHFATTHSHINMYIDIPETIYEDEEGVVWVTKGVTYKVTAS